MRKAAKVSWEERDGDKGMRGPCTFLIARGLPASQPASQPMAALHGRTEIQGGEILDAD